MNNYDGEDLINADDFEYAIQILRWLFQPIGIWPLKSAGYPSLLRPISIMICIWSASFMVIPGILAVIRIKNNFSLRVRLIGPISFYLITSFKYFVFLIKNHQFYSYLMNIALDWREMKKNNQNLIIMLQKTQTSRFFMTICAMCMYLSGITYMIVLPITKGSTQMGNVTLRNLPYVGYYIFFDQYTNPYYYVVYVMQCTCSIFCFTTCNGVSCLSIQTVLHISGRCDITTVMIKDLNGNFDEKSLKTIVKFQLHSLKFAKQIENLLTEMFLVEFVGSTFNICLLVYYFMGDFKQNDTVGTVTYVLLFISFTLNIFIFCYLGEHLTEQCASVGATVYAIDWFKLSAKKSRDLCLLVLFSQRPVFITAGKMVNFSLLSFVSLMKASAAYFNMLYKMG